MSSNQQKGFLPQSNFVSFGFLLGTGISYEAYIDVFDPLASDGEVLCRLTTASVLRQLCGSKMI